MNNIPEDQERIDVIPAQDRRWTPVIGEEITSLLNHLPLDDSSKRSLKEESVSILSECISPVEATGQRTGLVVGHVQSGKTMSFTAVTTLARDNCYPLIIVIAGTSIALNDQSKRRLRYDLRLDYRNDHNWLHIHNPTIHNDDYSKISNYLRDWQNDAISLSQRTCTLITVMKHHVHLQNLINVLARVDLKGIPVLIIDDEADQAGLNNLIRDGDESTTYRRLLELKNAIPHHTFLQYTATPQGPLLINLIDVLSPKFAKTLSPGNEYTGGKDFFKDNTNLIREIPQEDIPTRDNHLEAPPDSLLEALRLFFLGVASGFIRDKGKGNRSMMVHPSYRVVGHQIYYNWIYAIKNSWTRLLQNPLDPDYSVFMEDFLPSYNDLRSTVRNIESFEQLKLQLECSLRKTVLHPPINTSRGKTPQIDWGGAYSHILVGGQVLDRGFTVEGLTVTYMPRGVGARQADTIQQRARFFGYKKFYLEYCRIFLEPELSTAYTRYVDHERDVLHRLQEYEGRSLRELRRAFLVPQGFKPTRDSIIDIDYVRVRVNEDWFYPRCPHDCLDAIIENRKQIANFLSSLKMTEDDGHPKRTKIERHQVAKNLSLGDVYENLLLNLRFTSLSDAQNLLGVLIIIRQAIISDPNIKCALYIMSHGMPRVRRLNQHGEIPNLFQGANPVYPLKQRGDIYPGDRHIREDDQITIQIHMLDLREPTVTGIVPNIAIYIPEGLTGDVIIQDQGDAEEYNDE
ncbi:MAG TPA: Z1 domain-containing protein [archaeon]|nr:Z1 domain-containing protein [archaeon]